MERILIKLNICFFLFYFILFYFFDKNEELLEKQNKIWNKASNTIRKRFDSKTVYKKKYLKSKIKSYKGKINTSFHGNELPK